MHGEQYRMPVSYTHLDVYKRQEQASSFIADAALAIVVMADPLASDVWIEDASIASIMIQLQFGYQ